MGKKGNEVSVCFWGAELLSFSLKMAFSVHRLELVIKNQYIVEKARHTNASTHYHFKYTERLLILNVQSKSKT